MRLKICPCKLQPHFSTGNKRIKLTLLQFGGNVKYLMPGIIDSAHFTNITAQKKGEIFPVEKISRGINTACKNTGIITKDFID
jgi:hypothetical protein